MAQKTVTQKTNHNVIVAYHGTNSKFDVFDNKENGKINDASDTIGTWFNTNPARASMTARNAGLVGQNNKISPRIIEAGIHAVFPLQVGAPISTFSPEESALIINLAKTRGHDAVIFGGEMGGDDIVVLDPGLIDIKGSKDIDAAQYSTGEPPLYYSPLLDALSAFPQDRATPEHWRGILKNFDGVKGEEIAKSSIIEFLADRSETVEKTELLELLKEARVEIIKIEKKDQTTRPWDLNNDQALIWKEGGVSITNPFLDSQHMAALVDPTEVYGFTIDEMANAYDVDKKIIEEWVNNARSDQQRKDAIETFETARDASNLIINNFIEKYRQITKLEPFTLEQIAEDPEIILKEVGEVTSDNLLIDAPQVDIETLLDLIKNSPEFMRSLTRISRAKDSIEVAQSALRNTLLVHPSANHETNYLQHILPGQVGGYHEMLLTLPVERAIGDHLIIKPPEDGRFKLFDTYENAEISAHYSLIDAEKFRLYMLDHPEEADPSYCKAAYGPNVYFSPHWEEPNVLVHIRYTEREDTIGRRLLVIGEIQSDWHQDGRKYGYLASDDETNFSVPDAPFKKTWHELAVRRIAHLAAEQGYDGIAWTPGSVQASRATEASAEGIKYFYDDILAKYIGQYAENNRSRLSETQIAIGNDTLAVPMIPVTATMRDRVKEGVSLYSTGLPDVEWKSADKIFWAEEVLSGGHVEITPKDNTWEVRHFDGLAGRMIHDGTLPTIDRAKALGNQVLTGHNSNVIQFSIGQSATRTSEMAAAAFLSGAARRAMRGKYGHGDTTESMTDAGVSALMRSVHNYSAQERAHTLPKDPIIEMVLDTTIEMLIEHKNNLDGLVKDAFESDVLGARASQTEVMALKKLLEPIDSSLELINTLNANFDKTNNTSETHAKRDQQWELPRHSYIPEPKTLRTLPPAFINANHNGQPSLPNGMTAVAFSKGVDLVDTSTIKTLQPKQDASEKAPVMKSAKIADILSSDEPESVILKAMAKGFKKTYHQVNDDLYVSSLKVTTNTNEEITLKAFSATVADIPGDMLKIVTKQVDKINIDARLKGQESPYPQIENDGGLAEAYSALAVGLRNQLPADVSAKLIPATDTSVDDDIQFTVKHEDGSSTPLATSMQIGDGYIALNRNNLEPDGEIRSVSMLRDYEANSGDKWMSSAITGLQNEIASERLKLGIDTPQKIVEVAQTKQEPASQSARQEKKEKPIIVTPQINIPKKPQKDRGQGM